MPEGPNPTGHCVRPLPGEAIYGMLLVMSPTPWEAEYPRSVTERDILGETNALGPVFGTFLGPTLPAGP